MVLVAAEHKLRGYFSSGVGAPVQNAPVCAGLPATGTLLHEPPDEVKMSRLCVRKLHKYDRRKHTAEASVIRPVPPIIRGGVMTKRTAEAMRVRRGLER